MTLYQNISPSPDHWLGAGPGHRLSGCSYIFGKSEARVELYMQRATANEKSTICWRGSGLSHKEKAFYDAMAKNESAVEI